jgi:PAS domain S-box-containing protein
MAEQVFGELFYDVFNASPIGIVVRNLEGQLLFANRFLCSMLGSSEEEMRSRHCVDFSLSEDAEKDSALFQQLRAGLIDRYQTEKRFIRRDGSLIWGRLSISLLNRTSPLVLSTVEDITERKLAEEAFADVSRKLIEIQEKERTRIARELHDDINQRLALLAIEVDTLNLNPPNSAAELSRQLTEVWEGINEVSAEVLGRRLRLTLRVMTSASVCLRIPHCVSSESYRKHCIMLPSIAEHDNSKLDSVAHRTSYISRSQIAGLALMLNRQ